MMAKIEGINRAGYSKQKHNVYIKGKIGIKKMRTERAERHWGGGKIIFPFYIIKFCALERSFRKAKMRLKKKEDRQRNISFHCLIFIVK